MIGTGYGAKSAITINADSCVTGSFIAVQSIITGSATIDASAAEGAVVAQGDADDISITSMENVVWGDNRNVSSDGLQHFASHSVDKINLPAGATMQGPIFSFKVLQGSAIGYLNDRNFSKVVCPE